VHAKSSNAGGARRPADEVQHFFVMLCCASAGVPLRVGWRAVVNLCTAYRSLDVLHCCLMHPSSA